MSDTLNTLLLQVMDVAVGWVLALPRDAALVVIAVATAGLLILTRQRFTNQELLRRCGEDRRRLRERLREARRARDRETMARLRLLRGRISLKAISQEWKPLCLTLLPIALLAVWCWHRLEFLPPRPGEPLVFTASFPISADGQPAHLVPSSAIEAPQGWIRTIRVETNAPVARASWLLTAQPGAQVVVLRYGEHAFEHPLQVGGRHYAPPEQHHAASAVRTVVELEPARFLGVVPGIPALGLAPWMTAYLLLAVICFLAGKRLLRVA